MKCEECTLDSVKVKAFLPNQKQYNLLVVGQAPGRVEVVTGVPFTGSAGKMLFSLMKEAGLYKSNFPQTNLVMCKPPDDGKGNDRAPTPQEIHCCFRHLFEEIQDLKPDLILALGGPSALTLTGKEGILTLRGQFFPLRDLYQHDCSVLCLLHPSFVMRQRQWIPIAVKDLMTIHDFYSGNLKKRKEITYLIDPTYSELEEYLYSSKEVYTFDCETTSLNPREAVTLGIGMSRDDISACGIYFKPNDERIPLVKRWLETRSIPKCAQNGSYDCEVLRCSMQIEVGGMIFDTRLAEQLLNSDMPKNLDHLRAVYTDVPPYKPNKKEMVTISSWGKDRMLKYVCLDALTTWKVMKEQKKQLTSQQAKLQETLLVPLIRVLNYMEHVGMNVDVGKLALLYSEKYLAGQELEKKIYEEIGINPSSPKQITEKFDLKGSDRKELEHQIQRGHPAAEHLKMILQYRDLTKGAGTFLKGVYDRLEDGRIHTQYNIEGTGTGRLSSENPNLQNVPKPFRVIYIADDPDSVLIRADYKQLELWVVSILAPCPVLYAALKAGRDIHGQVLEKMKDYIPDRFLDKRMIAKSVVFGSLYGMSARTIAINYGVQVATAQQWQDILLATYPGLKTYAMDRQNDVLHKGYVTTPFGRKRYVQTVPQGLNAPVQSSASDVTLNALNRVYYEGYLDVRLQVHDEIVIHSSKEDAKKNAKLLKELMSQPVPEMNNQCFQADIKIGENWYDMKEVEV